MLECYSNPFFRIKFAECWALIEKWFVFFLSLHFASFLLLLFSWKPFSMPLSLFCLVLSWIVYLMAKMFHVLIPFVKSAEKKLSNTQSGAAPMCASSFFPHLISFKFIILRLLSFLFFLLMYIYFWKLIPLREWIVSFSIHYLCTMCNINILCMDAKLNAYRSAHSLNKRYGYKKNNNKNKNSVNMKKIQRKNLKRKREENVNNTKYAFTMGSFLNNTYTHTQLYKNVWESSTKEWKKTTIKSVHKTTRANKNWVVVRMK